MTQVTDRDLRKALSYAVNSVDAVCVIKVLQQQGWKVMKEDEVKKEEKPVAYKKNAAPVRRFL